MTCLGYLFQGWSSGIHGGRLIFDLLLQSFVLYLPRYPYAYVVYVRWFDTPSTDSESLKHSSDHSQHCLGKVHIYSFKCVSSFIYI